MQDISSTALAASRAADNTACIQVLCKWGGSAWVDETANVKLINISVASASEQAGVVMAGNAIHYDVQITLKNSNHRFTPWYVSSPIHASLVGGAWEGTQVQVRAGYFTNAGVAEYVTCFTGIISRWRISMRGQNIQWWLLDMSATILNYPVHTPLYQNIRTDEAIEVLRLTIPMALRPTAIFDKGQFILPFFHANGDNLFQKLTELALIEGGRCYYNYNGNLVFENGSHLLTEVHQSSVATYTVASFAELDVESSHRDYYNEVIVWFSTRSAGPYKEVWTLDKARYVPAQTSSEIIKANFDGPVLFKTNEILSSFKCCTAGGTDKSNNPDVGIIVTPEGQQASITIENLSNDNLYFVGVHVYGHPIVTGDKEKVSASVSDAISTRAGPRAFEINSDLIQDHASATAIRDYYLGRLPTPQENYTLDDIRSVFWHEIGDRITVQETSSGLNIDCFVQRINWTLSIDGAGRADHKMSLGVTPCSQFFQYNDFFILGTNTLGSTSSTPGRLWI